MQFVTVYAGQYCAAAPGIDIVQHFTKEIHISVSQHEVSIDFNVFECYFFNEVILVLPVPKSFIHIFDIADNSFIRR